MTKAHQLLIRAIAGDPASADWSPPTSLEWMPGGKHTVWATGGDGKGVEVTSNATPEDAARLDAQLQAQLALAAEGKASRPFIDFDHEGSAASAIPVKFFWQDGIRLAVEWTARGIEALKGRVYSYFSPEYWMKGETVNLPEVGPIGGLVNTPAYQTIERLAAAMPDETGKQTKGTQMKELIAKLVLAGIMTAPEGEMTDDSLVEALKARIGAADASAKTATEEAVACKAKLDAHIAARATEVVDEAIKCGKIDASTKDGWVSAYKANPDTTKSMLGGILAKQPTQHGHSNKDLPGSGKGSEPTGLERTEAVFKAQLARHAANRN